MRPLRIKASAYPVSSGNLQGLQEMTDAEIEQYYSAILTKDFADNTDGTGTAEININGSGTTIGTATDTKRDDAVGTHPTDGASSTVTTYTAKQIETTASESITNRPLGYVSSGTVGIHEFDDTELDTDILDKVVDDFVAQGDYTIGQYKLSTSTPSGGTWTTRYTLVNTEVDGTSTTYYIWQKTAPTTAAVDNFKPLRVQGGGAGVQEMTVAEMEQIVPNLRNYMISSGKGKYVLQAAAPGSGTWVDQGSFTDTKKEVAAQNYTGSYEGTYTGAYTGGYTGAKNYAGTYTGTSAYAGNYTGAKNYAGTYTGTSGYSGTYSGDYTGSYAADYDGYAGTSYSGDYTGTYTGSYTGAKNYTGYYTGTSAYAGSYTGAKNYAGTYTGTSAYSGTYSGTYTGYYSGTYSGDTIQSSAENVSTVKLWLRTA
tara:strand:- start:2592 stop:3869 length:1278 start_codon:yes stop_codon:yes gene_type:complete